MWKLVKAELNYLKPAILGCYLFFMALCVVSPQLVKLTRYPPTRSDYLFNMIWWIIVVHLVVVFVTVYLEIKENRVKQAVVLPIARGSAGYARVVTPFSLLLVYGLLIGACALILLLVYPPQHAGSMYFEQEESWIAAMAVGVWLLITYVIRLFSEWQGRLILLALFVTIVFYTSVLPLFRMKLYDLIGETLMYTFELPQGVFVLVLLVLLFCALLQISFMHRRSYFA